MMSSETPQLPSRRGTAVSQRTSSTMGCLRDPYLQPTHEFTFTGYDIDADEPPKTPLKAREEELRKEYVATYRLMCNRLKISPTSFVERNLNQPEMRIRSHGLGPEGARALAVALVKNERVKLLDISDNHVGCNGAKAIAQMLEKNEHITEVMLSENEIGREGLEAVTRAVIPKDDLKLLHLSGNGICDKYLLPLCNLLENNIYLRELNISHNVIGEKGGVLLGKALANNDTLEILDVSWNHIRGKGAVAIGKGLKENRGLAVLNLSWNGLGHEGCSAIGAALARNKTLLELNLCNCRVNTEAAISIMKGLQKNNTLESLRLGKNPIATHGTDVILKAVKLMKSDHFKKLDMEDVPVTDAFMDIKAILLQEKHLKIIHGPLLTKRGKRDPKKEEVQVDPTEYFHTILAEKGLTALNERLEKEAENKEKEIRKKIMLSREEKARRESEERERALRRERGIPSPADLEEEEEEGEEEEDDGPRVIYQTKIVDGQGVVEAVVVKDPETVAREAQEEEAQRARVQAEIEALARPASDTW